MVTWEGALDALEKRTTYDPATDDDFRAALVCAWSWLCRGEQGFHVDPTRETWEQALIRVAALFLEGERLGRPRGAEERWEKIVQAAASSPSCARDGMVQGPRGLRIPLSSAPRSARDA